MYIGMAVAKMWDTEWEIYSKIEDLYAYMRDKRGYDAMDEYIREEVLLLQGMDYTVLEKVTGECASRVYNALMHQRLEPGTKEAFNGYVACLHQLYLFGAAEMMTIDTSNMCSHLQKKLFEEDGIYHPLWMADRICSMLPVNYAIERITQMEHHFEKALAVIKDSTKTSKMLEELKENVAILGT